MRQPGSVVLLLSALAFSVACGDSGTGGGGGGGAGAGGQPGTGGDPGAGGNGGSPAGVPTVAECASVCTASQAGSCTDITGDCNDCCDAGLTVSDCEPEQAALYACTTSTADPCDATCTAEGDALTECLTDYCLANLADPACGVLVGCQSGEGGAGGGTGGAGGA